MEIPDKTWKVILEKILSTGHGTVTMIVQDGRLIQLDKTEKIRLTPEPQEKGKDRAVQGEPPHAALRLKLKIMLDGLRYGQIIVVVKDHAITQIERLEKYRVNDWEGLFGEGI